MLLSGVYCDMEWDNILCWNFTRAGTTAMQACPGFVNRLNPFGERAHPLSAATTVMTEIIMIAIRINTITEFRKCVFDQLLIKEKENLGNRSKRA